jgi:hypothetical protein
MQVDDDEEFVFPENLICSHGFNSLYRPFDCQPSKKVTTQKTKVKKLSLKNLYELPE